MKKLFILTLTFFFLNCGTTYYMLKDGELPETKRKEEKVNWLAIVGDVAAGVTIPILTGNGAAMASSIIFVMVDFLSGCMYEKVDK